MDKKILKLEDVLAGIRPIVDANPTFIYPQQGDPDDQERCTCIEVLEDEDDEAREPEFEGEHYIYADCPWHLDDDNTCRYVQNDESPACVVGHYFVKLGFTDLYNFETKAPTFVLEAHGYEVEAPAQRFLNTIQSQQDQGWEWDQAWNQAIKDVDKYFAEAEVPYAEE